jgi:hypothetical protein
LVLHRNLPLLIASIVAGWKLFGFICRFSLRILRVPVLQV